MLRMPWREQIGPLVRRARVEAGLKQETLAEAVGVAPLSISHYENSRQAPRIEVLERIAEATGKPLAWFFLDDHAGQAPTEPAPTSSTAPTSAPSPPFAAPLQQAHVPALVQATVALIAQVVGQAVGQAVASLHTKLDAQASVLQSQASRLSSQAHELARLHKEVREQHRQANRLNDAKYRGCSSTRPTQPPSGAEAAGG